MPIEPIGLFRPPRARRLPGVREPVFPIGMGFSVNRHRIWQPEWRHTAKLSGRVLGAGRRRLIEANYANLACPVGATRLGMIIRVCIFYTISRIV